MRGSRCSKVSPHSSFPGCAVGIDDGTVRTQRSRIGHVVPEGERLAEIPPFAGTKGGSFFRLTHGDEQVKAPSDLTFEVAYNYELSIIRNLWK